MRLRLPENTRPNIRSSSASSSLLVPSRYLMCILAFIFSFLGDDSVFVFLCLTENVVKHDKAFQITLGFCFGVEFSNYPILVIASFRFPHDYIFHSRPVVIFSM